MKSILPGVTAGLFVIAAACWSSGSPGSQCTKYLACAYKIGGTFASSANTNYGADSACTRDPGVGEACEARCKSSNDAVKTSGLAADAGCA